MNKTLIIATCSYAGMGPYASEIVNSFNENDSVYFFLVDDERHSFLKNIDERLKHKCKIVYRRNSSWNKFCDLFFDSFILKKSLLSWCQENVISTLHFLTNDIVLEKTIRNMSKTHKVFFTIHDLVRHESRKAFYKEFRQIVMLKQSQRIIDAVGLLITNSKYQYNDLYNVYFEKRIFFHEFPSLVNKSVIEGSVTPKEIKNKQNYVLFFGRIEAYKGLDLLYNAFTNDARLKNYELVIAGGGNIYFNRHIEKEKNITFINRFIDDEEISTLFKNSAVTCYPYISTTQSGVISVSCYYQVPIVASDAPFFSNISDAGIGLNFKNGNEKDLADKVYSLLTQSSLTDIRNKEKEYYDSFYAKESLRQQLLDIYNS